MSKVKATNANFIVRLTPIFVFSLGSPLRVKQFASILDLTSNQELEFRLFSCFGGNFLNIFLIQICRPDAL